MEAIKLHEKLIRQRTDPSFWEANIAEAHSKVKTEKDARLFYCYLTTPRNEFDINMDVDNIKTLGDRMDEQNFKSGIKPLPNELTQDIYQNGRETIIRTRHKSTPKVLMPIDDDTDSGDDEKNPTR